MTIARSDSGGGAGIQADLKTFQKLGVYGTSVVTAVTAQNTLGVDAWDPVRPELVAAQIDAVATDLKPAAFKTGMLGSAAIVKAVADAIARHHLENFVLDPVLVSTSGRRLLDEAGEELLKTELIPRATLVTPNLDEAKRLVGIMPGAVPTLQRAAERFLALGANAVLIKGGHLPGAPTDVFMYANQIHIIGHPRIETTSTHGTGCALSAAITARLALGDALEDAVRSAIDFVQRALREAPGLGRGNGPLGI